MDDERVCVCVFYSVETISCFIWEYPSEDCIHLKLTLLVFAPLYALNYILNRIIS